jgi:predicted DNA-binding transcriptional regulator YafY
MRRADRLFQLVQLIRGRRLSTAAGLARRLEVSERTIYRDIAALQCQGVPIEGEAGVGYRFGAGFALPPLMFTPDEASALVAAARLAQSRLDPALARQLEAALGKVLSALPPAMRAGAEALALFAPELEADAAVRERLQILREAVQSRHLLRIVYQDQADRRGTRIVRPLACFCWGQVWTLAAWCERRQDFRSFRVDRMKTVEVLPQRFCDEAGRRLADFLRQVQSEASDGLRLYRSE